MDAALILLLALAGPPASDDLRLPAPSTTTAGYDATAFKRIDDDIIQSQGYLAAHPDQQFRVLGQEARRKEHYDEAIKDFRRAARFADKLSQGALAEMYWNGEGVPQDKVLAYAWMDLAAERGARILLAHRERYWAQMAPSEREQAVAKGQELYAEFGDAVAKPRLERKLSAARLRVTGSRVGWVGNLSVCIKPTLGKCGTTVTGEQYYADRYWNPKQYWAWQDRIILSPQGSGKVEIGPLETMRQQGDGEK